MGIAVWALVLLFGGCGPSVPDGGMGVSSPSVVNTGHVDRADNPTSSPIGGVTMPSSTLENGGDRAVALEQAEDHASPSDSSIPETIANDLTSPDARTRYRALDHWDAKDSKAPLDQVFEAMEDEDEAVRAKATAIVEQYWAAEEEKERS